MDERSEGRGRFIAWLVIVAVVACLWLFLRRPATQEAIGEAVDPFVPTASQLQERLDGIERARQVRDAINARAPGTAEDSE